VTRVLGRELLKAPLLPSLGRAHLDPRTAPLREEPRERGRVPGIPGHHDLRRETWRGPVVLEEERLEHGRDVLSLDVLQVKGVAVDQLAVAQRKHLHDGPVPLEREADDVDRADRAKVRSLAFRQMLDASKPVPVTRGLLETLVGGGVLHFPLELALNRLDVPREELDHLIDDRPIILLRHVAHARREAPLDVVVEARDPRVTPRLRPFAGPVREDPVEDVQRLADLLRVGVGPEVHDAPAVTLAREHHAGVLVLHGDGDVRKGLVVPEADVERRPVPLDEVLLEVQGLDLVLGHDHLDVLHPVRQLLNRSPAVLRLLKVGPHPRPEGLGFSDVEHVSRPIPEQVDPGLGRQAFQLIFEPGGHQASVAGRFRPKEKSGPGGETGPPQGQGSVREVASFPGPPAARAVATQS